MWQSSRRTVTVWQLLALSLACAAAQEAGQPPIADVRVESAEMSAVNSESVRISLRFLVTAKQSTTLRRVHFDQVSVNGVRIHIPPIQTPIRLKAGEPVDGIPEVEAEVPFRELDSLEPIRQMVREGKGKARAVLRTELQLSLFQKLALLAGGAWVSLPVEQEIPVALPGGAIGRIAALAALTAAEPVWIAGQYAQDWRRNRNALVQTSKALLRDSLVCLETRYELRSRSGEKAFLTHRSLAFQVGDGQFLAPAEALEPWTFDESIAEAIANGGVTVNEGALELVAATASQTFSTHKKEVLIVRKLRNTENAISIRMKRRYRVRFRSRDANAALLEIPALKANGYSLPPVPEGREAGWQTAVIARVRPGAGPAEPLLWVTEARIEDGRYRIRDPVDSSAFGSPVITAEGFVGLLQDETSAAQVKRVMEQIR